MMPARILIVEDEPITAMGEQQVLKELGHAVTAIALSGEAAIQRVEENKPDLVLMDIKLSGEMDGREAARQIRKKHDIPIIFITALGDKGQSDPAKLNIPEGYVYIVKPFTEVELSSAIKKFLDEDHE
jgi:CheY-like chemotaxis protein